MWGNNLKWLKEACQLSDLGKFLRGAVMDEIRMSRRKRFGKWSKINHVLSTAMYEADLLAWLIFLLYFLLFESTVLSLYPIWNIPHQWKRCWNLYTTSSTSLSCPYHITCTGMTYITACGLCLSGQPDCDLLSDIIVSYPCLKLPKILAYNNHSINVFWIEPKNNIVHWIPLKWKQ